MLAIGRGHHGEVLQEAHTGDAGCEFGDRSAATLRTLRLEGRSLDNGISSSSGEPPARAVPPRSLVLVSLER